MTKITIPIAFKYLRDPKRFKAAYGGRGGAKSHNFSRTLLTMGMERPLRIACGREIQKSIKDSVHALLGDIVRKHELTDFYQIQEKAIKGINGTQFMFIGLKHNTVDIKSLEGVDILWIEEAENVSKGTYEVIIPTIRKDNSEIWVSFNTKNISDPTYQLFVANPDDDIICKKVSWRDNPFFPEVLDKARRKLEKDDPEAYGHVWEGEPDTRKSGVVYAKELAKMREEGRICLVPYDPAFEVFTAWDLGYGKGNATSIWWLQFVGRELRWLEYYEREGEFIPHFAEIVKDKPYKYMKEGHFLPHDGAADNIRGASVPIQLAQLGIHVPPQNIIPRAANEGVIQGEREILSSMLAYSVFDKEKTADGVFGLEHYHFKYDEDRGRFKDKPYHDWASNPADAARYAALAAKLVMGGISKGPKPSFKTSANKTGWRG